MLRFIDAELPNINMVVGEDFDANGAIRFHISMDGQHSFFVLSIHDVARLRDFLTDENTEVIDVG